MNTIRSYTIGPENSHVSKPSYRFSSNNQVLATTSVVDVLNASKSTGNVIKKTICRVFTRQFWNPQFDDANFEQQFLNYRNAVYAKTFNYRGIALLLAWLYVLYAYLLRFGGLRWMFAIPCVALGGLFFCVPYFYTAQPFRRQNVILPLLFCFAWSLIVLVEDCLSIISDGDPVMNIDGYQILLVFLYGMLPSTQLNVTILAVVLSAVRGASVIIGSILFHRPINLYQIFVLLSSHILGIRLKKTLESRERENFWLRTCGDQAADVARDCINTGGHQRSKYPLHNVSRISLRGDEVLQVPVMLKTGSSEETEMAKSPKGDQVRQVILKTDSSDETGNSLKGDQVRQVRVLKTGTSEETDSRSSLSSKPGSNKLGITSQLPSIAFDNDNRAKQGEDPAALLDTGRGIDGSERVYPRNAITAPGSNRELFRIKVSETATLPNTNNVPKSSANTVGFKVVEIDGRRVSTMHETAHCLVRKCVNWLRSHLNLKDTASSQATWSAYKTYCNTCSHKSWTPVLVLVVLREAFNVLLTHSDGLLDLAEMLSYLSCLTFICLCSYAVTKFAPNATHTKHFQIHIMAFEIVLSLAYAVFYIAKVNRIPRGDLDQHKLLCYNYVMSVFFLNSTSASSPGCRTINQFVSSIIISFGSLVLFCFTSTIPLVHTMEVLITLWLNLAIARVDEGYFLDTWRIRENKTSLCDVLGSQPLSVARV